MLVLAPLTGLALATIGAAGFVAGLGAYGVQQVYERRRIAQRAANPLLNGTISDIPLRARHLAFAFLIVGVLSAFGAMMRILGLAFDGLESDYVWMGLLGAGIAVVAHQNAWWIHRGQRKGLVAAALLVFAPLAALVRAGVTSPMSYLAPLGTLVLIMSLWRGFSRSDH